MERIATPNVIEQMEKADRIKKTNEDLKALEDLNRKLYHLAERFCNFTVEESERLTAYEKVEMAMAQMSARSHISNDRRIKADLWQAVNSYAQACGGDTSSKTITGDRMDAVVEVEKVVFTEIDRLKDALVKLYEGDHVGTRINQNSGAWRVIAEALGKEEA